MPVGSEQIEAAAKLNDDRLIYLTSPVTAAQRDRVRELVRPNLRGVVSWAKSDALADFVVRSLQSADEEGLVLHPATLDGIGIYMQLLICGWLTHDSYPTEPIRDWRITEAGCAVLKQEG